MAVVYAIGSNGSGQLGIGHKEDVSVPKEVLFGNYSITGPVIVRAGGNHTLVLSDGRLFCSGDDSSGACGLSPQLKQSNAHFRKVIFSRDASQADENSQITYIAATWEASIIVKSDDQGRSNRVYSFGTGNRGELGLGEVIFRSSQPQLVTDFPPAGVEVVDLAASVNHVIVALSNGDVYGWGSGRKGQLGQPDGIVYSPRKIEGLDFKVYKVTCGREFTYLLGAPKDGKHLVIGTDKWGIKSSAPATVNEWKDAGASWGGIVVLLNNGKLLSWGRNDHGQLVPPNLPEITHVAVGSEHTLVLTVNGDVLAWGWGEHGNCGPNTIKGDIKGRWNVVASSQYLPPESKIVSVGSGCATSWICMST